MGLELAQKHEGPWELRRTLLGGIKAQVLLSQPVSAGETERWREMETERQIHRETDGGGGGGVGREREREREMEAARCTEKQTEGEMETER